MLAMGISKSPLRLKKVGMLFVSSNVSHFVDCKPYSKSVSIKFSGLETRIFETGSTNLSFTVTSVLSSSSRI